MTRLILGLLLGYLGFLVIRKVARLLGLWPQQGDRPAPWQEPDVLVQDPVCQTFIPRREALKVEKDGQVFFFCSEGCLKRFRRGGSS